MVAYAGLFALLAIAYWDNPKWRRNHGFAAFFMLTVGIIQMNLQNL